VQPSLKSVADDLYLITLNPPLRGFTHFIGVWLYRGAQTFMVDVGPSSTAEALLQQLDGLQLEQLDFILLTHIHLDHAGAIQQISARYPQTPIICHSSAHNHLMDPSRLWRGSQKVLGELATGYGPIKAVPAGRLLAAEEFRSKSIQPIITPGHATHHVSFYTPKYLFVGETAGVCLSLPGKQVYMRPATPPRFFLDIALESLDRLIAAKARHLCYSHYGLHPDAGNLLQIHRHQLVRWAQIIREVPAADDEQSHLSACLTRLMSEDPFLAHLRFLPSDEQDREKYFLKNSIRGFLGDLEKNGKR
jgi:glyoxylase-like metal-dependent hydrolase (beta-lactamase superfamily II)